MDSSDSGRPYHSPVETPEAGTRTRDQLGTSPRNPLIARWEFFVDELRGKRQFARRKVLVDRYQMERGTPELKIIGRTWVNRGPAYWLRRIAWSVVWLWIAFVGVGFAVTATVKLLTSPLPLAAGITIAVVWWISSVPAFVFPWRRLAVFPFGENPGSPFVFPGVLLAPLFILFLPVLAGMCSAIFLSTLRRNFPGEAAAHEAYDAYRDHIRSRRRSSRKRRH
jgi:hypothetical protein